MPKKQAKSSSVRKAASIKNQLKRNRKKLGIRPNGWTDAFSVHDSELVGSGDRMDICMSEHQWNVASKLVAIGLTIGFVTPIEGVPAIVAECSRRFESPIAATYMEDDLILYLAKMRQQ